MNTSSSHAHAHAHAHARSSDPGPSPDDARRNSFRYILILRNIYTHAEVYTCFTRTIEEGVCLLEEQFDGAVSVSGFTHEELVRNLGKGSNTVLGSYYACMIDSRTLLSLLTGSAHGPALIPSV